MARLLNQHMTNQTRNLLVTTFLLLTGLTNQLLAQSSAKAGHYVIIGYVTGDGWTKEQINPKKVTHINYAFAVPAATGDLAPLTTKDSVNLATLTSLKAGNKAFEGADFDWRLGRLQVLFRCSPDGCIAPERFANSAVALLKKHRLDGVDIDWEYPAQVGAGNIFRPADKQNFTLFLKAIRDRLDEQGRQDNRVGANHYLLTAATGADTAFVNHTELGKAQRYLDYVNIMTYDLYHGNDKVTGHHSNLYQSAKGDHSRNSSADAVDGHIRAGVPAHKIVLGLPFYGRGWGDVRAQDNGLFQPSAGEHSFISHDELIDKYINKNGFVRYWDANAKAPYLWNATSRTFISYTDEESFLPKLAYIKSKKLAGVMFWEYMYDVRHDQLLNVVVKGLK